MSVFADTLAVSTSQQTRSVFHQTKPGRHACKKFQAMWELHHPHELAEFRELVDESQILAHDRFRLEAEKKKQAETVKQKQAERAEQKEQARRAARLEEVQPQSEPTTSRAQMEQPVVSELIRVGGKSEPADGSDTETEVVDDW